MMVYWRNKGIGKVSLCMDIEGHFWEFQDRRKLKLAFNSSGYLERPTKQESDDLTDHKSLLMYGNKFN